MKRRAVHPASSSSGRKQSRFRRLLVEALESRRVLSAGDWLGSTPIDALSASPLAENVERNLAAFYELAMSSNPSDSAGPSSGSEDGDGLVAAQAGLLQLDETGRPLIDVWTIGPTAPVAARLQAVGAEVFTTSEAYHIVEAWLDIEDLPAVAGTEGVLSVTPIFRPVSRTGSVTSQGDGLHHADDVRDPVQFPPGGYDGSGVKVGVLSDSASRAGLAASQAGGDLPPVVEVLQEYRYSDGTDEGRAMLEIVHDLTPGAELAFHTAFHSELDYAQGIRELAAAGARVIVDDVAYFAEPFFQDGIIAQAIDEVVSDYGVTYVTAAGNENGEFHSAPFRAAADAQPGVWHDFDATEGVDTRLRITVSAGSRGMLVMQWSDPWYTQDGVTNDFDLYAFDTTSGAVVDSVATNNVTTQQPMETFLWGGHPYETRTYDVGIRRVTGDGDVELKLWAISGTMTEYQDGASLVGHAMAAGAISVGAVPFYDPDTIESYSSRGVATVYFDPQGNRLTTPEVRNKPDVVAVDDVNTTFFGQDVEQDTDTSPNFSGTSAAAPHVAAVAALLRSAQPSLSPSQVLAALQAEADDLGPAGWDDTYGAGRVNALAAVSEVLTNPSYDDTSGPAVGLQSPPASTARPIGFASLQFNERLDAATAEDAANYELCGSGPDGSFGSGDDVVYTVVSAYDTAARRVRLTWTAPGSELPVGTYRLTVGTGVLDLAGNPLENGTAQTFAFERTQWGEPFPVAPQGMSGHASVDVAVAPGGEAMVVWVEEVVEGSMHYYPTVYASILDANGAQIVKPFTPHAASEIESVAVTYDPTGHFIIAWYDRWAQYSGLVYLAKYDLTGHEEWIATARTMDAFDTYPDVAADGQGNVYVVWRESLWTGVERLWVRKFDPAGQPLTDPVRCDDTSYDNTRGSPSIAVDPQGRVMVTWTEFYSPAGIWARMLNADLTPQTGPFRVDPDTRQGALGFVQAAPRSDGFVITWEQSHHTYVRLYGNEGNALGLKRDVSGGLYMYDVSPHVAVRPEGSFAVGYVATNEPLASTGHLMLREFNAAGVPLGSEFEVPWEQLGSQSAGAAGVDGDGNLLVAWGGSRVGPIDGSPYARWLVPPLPTLPDLRIRNVSIPPRVTVGVTEQVIGALWNLGTAAVAATYIRYTLSSDAVLGNADDRLLVTADSYVSSLYAGEQQDDARDFVLPADTAPGSYTVFAQVDPAGWVGEADETNNVAEVTIEVSLPPAALGDLQVVNATTAGDQTTPAIAMAADGRYVVVWAGNGPGDSSGVFAQRYDAWGNRLGSEFRVNTVVADVQRNPAVAINTSGAFVVVWESNNQDGSGYGIYGQRFDADGTPLGSEFLVNDVTAGSQTLPAVARDANGDFVVAWQDSTGNGYTFYRRFLSDGTALAPATRLDPLQATKDRLPVLAMAADGRWVASWVGGWSLNELYAQRFNADGTRAFERIRVNLVACSGTQSPSVAMADNGDSLIAWTSGDGQIYAERFPWAETLAERETRVNTYSPGTKLAGAAAMAADGVGLVGWVSNAQNGVRLVGQRFDSGHQPLGSEFYFSSVTSGGVPAVAMSDLGHFAGVWQRSGDEGTTQGIFSRLFGTAPAELAELRAESVTGPAATYPGGPLAVTGAIRNVGALDAPAFDVQYFLSAQPAGAPLYNLGSAVPVADGLSAGSTWNDSRSITVPATGIPAGTYYLGLLADSGAAVAEHVEVDNRAVSLTPVVIAATAPPDLQVTSVDVTDTAVVRGRELTVTWTVINHGLGAAPSATWYDQVIVSSDAVLGNADDLAAEGPQFAHTGGLAVEASYEQTQTISVPFAFAGHLYVFVKTDVTSAITEPGCEGNNATFDPMPLKVEEVAASLPMTEGFEGGSVAAVPDWWAFDYGRVAGSDGPHTGAWHLLLDSTAGSPETQVAYLTVDVANQRGVILRYWQKEFSGESDGWPDAVSMSADGVKWYDLEALIGADSVLNYQQHIIDLDAATQLSGISYAERLYLRFRRNGPYGVPRAGFAFDDFQLATEAGDFWGAQVVHSTPLGPTTRPLETIELTFSEPMDAGTFTSDHIQLLDPSGAAVPIPGAGITTGDNVNFTVTFAPQFIAGTYRLIVGPQILDAAGNPMNQDQDRVNGATDDAYTATIQLPAIPTAFPVLEGFEGGSVAALGTAWSFSVAGTGTWDVTSQDGPYAGSYQLRVTQKDDLTAEMVLALDLSGLAGRTDLEMDFRAKRIGSSGNAHIFVSGDGSSWSGSLYWLRDLPTDRFLHYAFDLDQLLASASVALDSEVFVKIAYHGLYPSDRMTLDSFRVSDADACGPKVTAISPSGTTAAPLTSLQITFNEAIDAASFTASDVKLTGPTGHVAWAAADPVDTGDQRTFTVPLPPQWLAGAYTITVIAGIRDVFGNEINQDGDAANGETSGDEYQATLQIGPALPVALPYVQDFENPDLGSLQGWNAVRNGGTVLLGSSHAEHGLQAVEFGETSWHYGEPGYYRDLILHADLLDGAVPLAGVVLDFWLKEIGGGGLADDFSISLSPDGTTWTLLQNIAGSTTYQHLAFDLDAMQITYTDDFQLKFHHNSYGPGGFALDEVRVRAGALPINQLPTLTTISNFTGAAWNQPFTISFEALAAAADESDPDSGPEPLVFRVESPINGTVTKSGVPVQPGVTLLGPGESLVWTPTWNASGVLDAFRVRAWDGDLASWPPLPVKVEVPHGYRAEAYPLENIDLVPGAPGVVTLLDNQDDAVAALPLGGDAFTFFASSLAGDTTLYPSTNGLLTLASPGSNNPNNNDLTSNPAQAAVAALWDNWRTNLTTADAVLYKFEDLTGDGTDDRLIIEWNEVPNAGASASNPATFQAILQLNTAAEHGVVVLNYPDLDVGNVTFNNGAAATVGIKASGAQGLNRLLVSYNSGTNPLVGSGKAVRITSSSDAAAPTAVIGDVLPNPRNTAVDNVTIVFSEPVSGLDLSDLVLTRNGGANLLTEVQTLATSDQVTWTLTNLAPLTGAGGVYELQLTAAGSWIRDAAWNLLAGDAATAWTTATTLIVTSLTPTPSGFMAQFSGEFQLAGLNLYDGAGGTLGAADVVLQDGGGQVVAGSLTVDSSRHAITFIKTGGVLAPDTYSVTVKSGVTAFRDLDGEPLDGNMDGTAGDDYTAAFTVASFSGRVVSIPDIARGAGQPVDIPNTAAGLPIRLDTPAGVTSLAVDLVYDRDLLKITAATLASGMPGDWTVSLDTGTAGVAQVTASGTTALSGTNVEVVRLTAAVPGNAPYGAMQAIRLENVALNGGAIAAVGDVAVHKAAYLGDADGSGIHSSADAFLTVQAALGLASGFTAHAWTDPRIVGDADGSGVLSAADAFLTVQEGLGLSEPFVPDNPHIGITPVGGGVDPQFQISEDIPGEEGGVVTVPVRLDIEPAATSVGALDFDLFFAASRLTIDVPGGIAGGADTAGWALSAILIARGHLRVGMVSSNGQPLAPGLREIARLQFRVAAALRDAVPLAERAGYDGAFPVSERPGYVVLDIEPVDAHAGGYAWTEMDGSVAIAAAKPWHKAVDPLAVQGAAVQDQLFGDLGTEFSPLETMLTDLAGDVTAAWR